MNEPTYEQLPADVRRAFGSNYRSDEAVPHGAVDVYTDEHGGRIVVPAALFVRARRAARKRQRQNRRRGRRA